MCNYFAVNETSLTVTYFVSSIIVCGYFAVNETSLSANMQTGNKGCRFFYLNDEITMKHVGFIWKQWSKRSSV